MKGKICVHSQVYSFEWVLSWFHNSVELANPLPHVLHSYAFSPEWNVLCLSNLFSYLKLAEHWSHWNAWCLPSFEWLNFSWYCNNGLVLNLWQQSEHLNGNSSIWLVLLKVYSGPLYVKISFHIDYIHMVFHLCGFFHGFSIQKIGKNVSDNNCI